MFNGVLNKARKIHFIGIGGIGMCGLAEYFLKNGYAVTGSDLAASGTTRRLEEMGAEIHIGHSEENIPESTDIAIYTSAVKEDNPEAVKAGRLGIKLMKRAEMLGAIVNSMFLIAIAGTHGKTTTTAMIGKLLIDAGMDPLIFVGGNFELFGGGASRFGKGNFAVVEADEYDRSFLTLTPDVSVITSIDEDHLDIYKDIEEIKSTFRKFCGLSKPEGRLIYCGDDDNIRDFIESLKIEKFSYGFRDDNFLKITEIKSGENNIFYSVKNTQSTYKDIKLNLLGRHNVLNSAACFAVSKVLNIDPETYRESIAGFKTVDRRLQLRYDSKGIRIYDDYAHHPREISSSIEGLKEFHNSSHLIAVFQPHLFTRTRDMYKSFANELARADEIILLDIYPAREKPIEGITSKLIYNELKKLNKKVNYFHSNEETLNYLYEIIKPGYKIIFQGAGDITELCTQFINKLK